MSVNDSLSAMHHPVQCRWCGTVHDAGTVTVVSRYTDCSVWRCPGCQVLLDDRPPGWGGSAYPIDKTTGEVRR